MDLGTTTPIGGHRAGGDRGRTRALLAAIQADTEAITAHEIARVEQIAAWAVANTVTSLAGAATVREGRLDTGVPIAGDGAPLVSDLELTELCAVLGRSLDSGRHYVGQVIELAFRLPDLHGRTTAGRVPVWKALKIADATRSLPADGAAFVDHHLAQFAGGATWSQVDRLVEEARVRFDPETAAERRRRAADGRHLDVHADQVSYDGTVAVDGELDLADALEFDAALARGAQHLAELGCEESLDVRRSIAAGDLARRDLLLDLPLTEPAAAPTRRRPGRTVELSVHLSEAALAGSDPVARVGNTRTPISPQQVKEWCATPDATVVVRPVVDLAGHEPLDAYEIPDRHRRQVALRDPHCVFPHCTRRAERCDLDHVVPHGQGGATCPCNLAPECRTHHRAKTHRGWSCLVLEPGSYLWTSPHGRRWLVDHRGTRPIAAGNCRGPQPPDQ